MKGRLAIPVDRAADPEKAMAPHYARLWRFLRLTGCRLCEGRLLLVEDILNEDGSYREPFLELSETKGGYRRQLTITPEIIALFEECRLAYGGDWGPRVLAVFRSKNKQPWAARAAGRRLNGHGVSKKWSAESKRRGRQVANAPRGIASYLCHEEFRRALDACGLGPAFASHSNRKGMAKALFDSGADIYAVKEHLGHANISTTCDYLNQMTAEMALKTIDAAYKAMGLRKDTPAEALKKRTIDPGLELY